MRIHLLLATLMLVCFVTAAWPAAPPLESLRQWDPSESWEGGKDHDARLDRPVAFWRAGLSLEEVFAGIEQQTGVKLRFFPEGDENRRVRVHLFLNQEEPPSLRGLMAQLMWVVDCPFFLAEEPEGKTYYLMSTSMAAGAGESLAARVEAIWKAREGRWHEIGGKVGEYREALDLPREELIEKYRGTDDLLLLNLLDPERRAATRFVCRQAEDRLFEPHDMPGEHGEVFGVGNTVSSGSFTKEDITDLAAAFSLPESALRDPEMAFDLHLEVVGRLTIGASPEYTQRSGQRTTVRIGPYVIADLTDEFELSAEDRLALRRALGEDIPTDEKSSRLQELKQEITAAKQARARDRLKAERALSPHAEEELAGVSVTLRGVARDFPVTPWTAQEAVARATGKHVVSDGMLWSGRYLYPPVPGVGETPTTRTALAVLDSFTHQPLGTGLRTPSWEWGDAGRFLRFRTADRDTWRAAMPPPEFVTWVDALLAPHLPDAETLAARKRMELSIPVGLVHAVRMIGKLSDVQLQFGREVNCGDPADLVNIVRHEAMGPFLNEASMKPKLTRFLASLTDEQWAQLKGAGLCYDPDLNPDQRKRLTAAMASTRTTYDLSSLVLTLDPVEEKNPYYLLHLKMRTPTGPEKRIRWDWSLECAPRALQVEAWSPGGE